MTMQIFGIAGSGLGLRRSLLAALQTELPDGIDFLEVSPENWIGVGGYLGKSFRSLTERHSFVAHGLSLSLGGMVPLDTGFLHQVKRFLDTHNIDFYTEHLSFCGDEGHLYDLYPIPFTEAAVRHVSNRIRQTQEILERPIAVENISYYLQTPYAEMDELGFIRAVLEEADCLLHVDINNIYVNSVNHGFDPSQFLRGLPSERIAYAHMAGHDQHDSGLIIDTHGATIIDPVWQLLEQAYQAFGVFPTVLERDTAIPALPELLPEIRHIKTLQQKYGQQHTGQIMCEAVV